MKVCAIICEFNPFHNGHKYLIEQIKATNAFDAVLCLMSGHFTQRGNLAVLDKYTRAKHAVLGGADLVIELPTPFAVAPAEVFAEGAVKLLASIPEVTTLAFGCESATKEELKKSATLLVENGKSYFQHLKEELATGESYSASARKAFLALGGNKEVMNGSNNVLALEYTKAILRLGAKLDILPIRRMGADFNDEELAESAEALAKAENPYPSTPSPSATLYSSATAIRKHLGAEELKNAVPPFVFFDLPTTHTAQTRFEELQRFALLNNSPAQIAQVYGCSEGLENKLKSLCQLPYAKLIEAACGKRYVAPRIQRVLCGNLLKLNRNHTAQFLQSDLYLKPLAVNKQRADELLSMLGKSAYPVVVLQRQLSALSEQALACLQANLYADEVYSFITSQPIPPFTFCKV